MSFSFCWSTGPLSGYEKLLDKFPRLEYVAVDGDSVALKREITSPR